MKRQDLLSIFRKYRLILAILVFAVSTDQWTKVLAKSHLRFKATSTYLGDTFRLQYSENPGAFLSLGAGLSDNARFWIFVVLVSGFLLLAGFYMIKGIDDFWQTFGLAWMIGGGIGNLIDRALYGRVVDFMNMGIGDLRTGIFNMADVYIMAGMFIILLVPPLVSRRKRQKQA